MSESSLLDKERFFKLFFNIDKIYEYKELQKIDPEVYKKIDSFMLDLKKLFNPVPVLVPYDKTGVYWTDYSFSYCDLRKIPLSGQYMVIEIPIKEGKIAERSISIQFEHFKTKQERTNVSNILEKHFSKNYQWNGSNEEYIRISCK